MNLASHADSLFQSLKPSLTKTARSLNCSDPAGEATSWYIRFLEILKDFDSGHLKKAFPETDAQGVERQILAEPATPAQITAFNQNLRSYLLQAFSRDLKKEHRKARRYVCVEDVQYYVEPRDGPEDAWIKLLTEQVSVDDLLKIIRTDLKEARASVKHVQDRLNVLFLQSVVSFYEQVRGDKNFPIVADYNADDQLFFLKEAKNDRLKIVKERFLGLLEVETNPVVKKIGLRFFDTVDDFSLSRRLNRYFETMPSRLREELEAMR